MTQYIYLGPSRPFGMALANKMILRGEPQAVFPDLAGKFGEYPSFRRLFVPVTELATARKALATPGTAIYLANAEMLKAIRAAKQQEKEQQKKKGA